MTSQGKMKVGMRSVLLLTAISAGCLGEAGENRRIGVVAPAAASGVDQVVIAWTEGDYADRRVEVPEPLDVQGNVEVANGSFDLDELTASVSDPEKPTTCLGNGLSLGLLVGAGAIPPTDVDLLEFPADLQAFSQDVLAVWADEPIRVGTSEWQAFETVIPQGATLYRHVPCRAWRSARCRPFGRLQINCLEPLASDAVVVLDAP